MARARPITHTAAAIARIALVYGGALAALALLLAWMDHRQAIHGWPGGVHVLAVALIFAGLGGWLGNRLTPRARAAPFTRNEAARVALGISAREFEVLDQLAGGAPNKAIARRLAISPNTVKTHVARLFEKLEATNRTEAIAKARSLHLLP